MNKFIVPRQVALEWFRNLTYAAKVTVWKKSDKKHWAFDAFCASTNAIEAAWRNNK